MLGYLGGKQDSLEGDLSKYKQYTGLCS